MRWLWCGVSALLSMTTVAEAQWHQIVARGDAYSCELSTCEVGGEPCDYGGVTESCVERVAGAPVCSSAGHTAEAYCCFNETDCPAGTACVPARDLSFGVCLGAPSGAARYCGDPPTQLDLMRCRDVDFPGTYDWGHGDCDGDGELNNEDADLCGGPPMCPCDADVVPNGGAPYQVDTADIEALLACVDDSTPPACDRADLNCDGRVDHCDVGVAQKVLELGLDGPDHFICTLVECGACEVDDQCLRASLEVCSEMLGGDFRGDGTRCRAPPADAGTDPDSGTPSPNASFRGGGGCACHVPGSVRHGSAGSGAAFFALLLPLALRRVRRAARAHPKLRR